MSENRSDRTLRVCFIGLMTAIVFVSNYFRIPFMDTKLTVSNALCAISGLLLGPIPGFAAAGVGSCLYDVTTGYGAESLVTLVSKGAIGLIAGLIAFRVIHRPGKVSRRDAALIIAACAVSALSYVALYMLKTYIFGLTVNGLTLEATFVKMGAKLPGSLINAAFAVIAGPVLAIALKPALEHAGLLKKMTGR